MPLHPPKALLTLAPWLREALFETCSRKAFTWVSAPVSRKLSQRRFLALKNNGSKGAVSNSVVTVETPT